MKKLRFLTAALTLVMTIIGSLSASAENDAERIAREFVNKYLDDKGYPTQVDPTDNSVVFKKSSAKLKTDVIYWITFKGNAKTMRYTLHREPVNFIGSNVNEDEIIRRREVAPVAAYNMTAENPLKVIVNGDKLEYETATFASTPKDFVENCLPAMISILEDANKVLVDKYWTQAKDECAALRNRYISQDNTRLYLPENETVIPSADIPTTIDVKNVAVGSAEADGSMLVTPGAQRVLTTLNARYLVPKISFAPKAAGVVTVAYKIIDPDGRVVLVQPGDDYSAITVFEVNKKDLKNVVELELEKFGTDQDDFWKPGMYKIAVYENGRELYNTPFTIKESKK